MDNVLIFGFVAVTSSPSDRAGEVAWSLAGYGNNLRDLFVCEFRRATTAIVVAQGILYSSHQGGEISIATIAGSGQRVSICQRTCD